MNKGLPSVLLVSNIKGIFRPKIKNRTSCDLSGLNVPKKYGSTICSAALKNKIPPRLLAAQIRVESHFDPTAISVDKKTGKKIAYGIAQFTLPTAKAYNLNPMDPYASIRTMAYKVSHDYATFRRQGYDEVTAYSLAFAFYNGGGGGVEHVKKHNLRIVQNTKAAWSSFANQVPGYLLRIWESV